MKTRVYFDILDPDQIFGMVGRCGGGYNTVWQDWTPDGRIARENIMREYEEGLNEICGHYDRLEKSILEDGFRNPLILSCGVPRRCKMHHLPPEIIKLPPKRRLLLEGVTGGSRLWVAQKHKIPVPCIINDYLNVYNKGTYIRSKLEADVNFKDVPQHTTFNQFRGFTESYDNKKLGYHMDPMWTEEAIAKLRAPLWVGTMNRYGYYVDRLQPFILKILSDAGVVQPEHLKKRFNER